MKQFFILTIGLAVSGCAVGDEEPLDAPKTVQPALTWGAGSVSVEYDPAQGDDAKINAHFLLASNVERRAAFDALEIWSPDHELDEDACSVIGSSRRFDDPTLRLLGVESITIATTIETIELAERRLPDAVPGISGVVYGSDEGFEQDAVEIPFRPGESYLIRAAGSEEIGGFEVELVAPEPTLLTNISGVAVGERQEVALSSADDLVLNWSSADDNAELFLHLKGTSTMTCRVTNDGEFTVPAHLVRSLGSDVDVSLRTIQTQSLVIERLGPTDFVVGTVDNVRVTLP